jgi:hypothetical protein
MIVYQGLLLKNKILNKNKNGLIWDRRAWWEYAYKGSHDR